MNLRTETFTDYLLQLTKKELTTIARLHHIPKYSSLCKADLAVRTASFLLQPEVMQTFFSCLGKDEKNACLSSAPSRDALLMKRLTEAGYCFLQPDGSFVVPEEVKNQFLSFRNTDASDNKKGFLIDCLYAAGYLYGCFPIRILLKMYNSFMEPAIKSEEFLRLFEQIPDYFRPFILKGELCIHTSLYEHDLYRKIQQCQGTLPFYIPPKKDIIGLARYGYFPEDVRIQNLSRILGCMTGLSMEKSIIISGKIQAVFRQGGTISDALLHLKTIPQFPAGSLRDKKILVSLNDVFAHTRLLLNRGYTAAQAMELKKKTTRIYPNTPCPCGSGKKYKNCCGRHH